MIGCVWLCLQAQPIRWTRGGIDVDGDLSFAGNIEWREAHTLRRWA